MAEKNPEEMMKEMTGEKRRLRLWIPGKAEDFKEGEAVRLQHFGRWSGYYKIEEVVPLKDSEEEEAVGLSLSLIRKKG